MSPSRFSLTLMTFTGVFEWRERSDLVTPESERRLEDLVRVPELGSECRR